MSTIFWSFLIGITVGALTVWVAPRLTGTMSPVHPHTQVQEHLTVQRIAARIERERLEGERAQRRARSGSTITIDRALLTSPLLSQRDIGTEDFSTVHHGRAVGQ